MMQHQEYWAALEALGVRREATLNEASVLCRTRDGRLITVEDPRGFTPEQRLQLFRLYRDRLTGPS